MRGDIISSNNNGGSTFPLFGILGIAFIVLKLTEVIDWSWWWVLAPFWGPLALAVVIAVIVVIAARKAKAKVASSDPFDHPFFKNA